MLTFKLLGEATIALNNSPVTEIGSRTAEALLIYLACEQRPFARQYLAELFWEERDPEQSAANLRAALSMLRKQVGDYLIVTRQTAAFNSELPHHLDINEFTTTADGGRRTTDGEPLSAVYRLSSAVALYAGDFLDGFYLRESRAFEEWSLLKREQLQQQAILLLRRLLADPAVMQDATTALAYASQLLALNPFSEYAYQQKITALARSGQLRAALQQYQACRAWLQAELGVEPGPETAALAQRIERASQTPRHNLPPAPTPFVGRAQELADLQARLIDPRYRLLTLIGSGGAGKTRLALEAARRLVATGYFLNGLRFISLVNADAPGQIPPLVAAELGLTLQGEGTLSDQLAAALAGEEMLLILDNLEHLMEGAAGDETADLLARLLGQAPLLTLLVTSRRRLQLQEEWLFDVSGLALPEANAADATAADATSADSIQLFLQTAERMQRHFQATADDLTAVVRLCRALEGLPLGIELAAGWLRQLSCAEIARQLDESMALLATDLRNVPARQRSMTAVFDYSWSLLPDRARQLLARLSIFRGGFTAVAAQATTGAGTADLALLVDHSLLRVVDGRYTLHELLRQYAADRLEALGENETIAQAHAAYFLDYLQGQGEGEKAGQRQAIRLELANIRAAWETAVSQEDEAALLQAAGTLHNFYSAESRFQEGIALFQGALRREGRRAKEEGGRANNWPPPVLQADLLGRTARMQIHIGQVKTAGRTLDSALAALSQVDDPARQSTLLGYVAITAYYAGEFARAAALAEESRALAERLGDQDGVAFALTFLGSCHKSRGDYAAAADSFHRAVAVYEQMGDDLGKGMALNNLGNLAQAQGDFAAAQDYYLTCSRIFQEQEHLHGASTTLSNAGRLALRQGAYEQARQLLTESLQLKRALNDGRGEGVALAGLGAVSTRLGEYTRAWGELQGALQLARQSGDDKLAVEVLLPLAAYYGEQGELARAGQLLAFVQGHQAAVAEIREEAAQLAEQLGVGAAVAPAVDLAALVAEVMA